MLTISLDNLKFIAYHGIYDEERILGNEYLVNCEVRIPEPDVIIEKIGNTVNYKSLFDLIKENMEVPTPLLETVCMRIGKQIHQHFPGVTYISVSIQKLHPPVDGFTGSSSVHWQHNYS